MNSESVALYATLFRLLVVPDVLIFQVTPSVLVKIVPMFPTAINIPLPYVTSTKLLLVPDVCSTLVCAPSVLVNICPAFPTMTTKLLLLVIELTYAEVITVVIPSLTISQIVPLFVLRMIIV